MVPVTMKTTLITVCKSHALHTVGRVVYVKQEVDTMLLNEYPVHTSQYIGSRI